MIHYNLHYIIVYVVNASKNASLELLYDHYSYKTMNFNHGIMIIIIIIRQQCLNTYFNYIFCMVLYLEYMYACSILFDKNK